MHGNIIRNGDDNMPASEAKIRANARYNNKTYDVVQIRVLKTERINDLVDLAASRSNTSKAAYILAAIKTQLAKDGITIYMLPDASQGTD